MSVSGLLGAGLSGEGQGDLLAVGLADDDLGLVDRVGAILELGHVEALLLLDVVAHDLGDGDVLVDAGLDGLGGGNVDGHVQGFGDQRDAVLLGLVLLAAVLVLSGALLVAVAGRGASGHLHGLGLLLVGHLRGNEMLTCQ